MNQEHFPSTVAGALSISGRGSIVSRETAFAPGSDDAFQKLLLRIAARAGERSDSKALIQLFCRATREFFKVSGVYFWRSHPGQELVGEQADGKMADRFVGLRVRPDQSAVTAEAVRQRRTIFGNHVNSSDLSGRRGIRRSLSAGRAAAGVE